MAAEASEESIAPPSLAVPEPGDPNQESDRSGDGTLSLEESFELLKNQRRRSVVWYLEHGDGHTTLGELAEQLAAWEAGKPVGDVTADERERLYVSLYQYHLPKLADAGVLEFDPDRGTVRRTAETRRLVRYLEFLGGQPGDDTDSRHVLHLGAALLGSLVLALQAYVFPSILLTGFLVLTLAVGVAASSLTSVRVSA